MSLDENNTGTAKPATSKQLGVKAAADSLDYRWSMEDGTKSPEEALKADRRLLHGRLGYSTGSAHLGGLLLRSV